MVIFQALYQHMRDKADDEHTWYVQRHGLGPYPNATSLKQEEQDNEMHELDECRPIFLPSYHVSRSKIIDESQCTNFLICICSPSLILLSLFYQLFLASCNQRCGFELKYYDRLIQCCYFYCVSFTCSICSTIVEDSARIGCSKHKMFVIH